MKVYVIEKVNYDYYRFDDVLGVALSEEKAIEIAEHWRKKNKMTDCYEIKLESEGYDQDKYDTDEERHIYISYFEVDE